MEASETAVISGRSDKRALLQRLLVEKQFKVRPLSYAQERIWFTEHLNPNTSNWHIMHVMRVEGPRLDREIVERCWQCMLDRHEILRTKIIDQGSGPKQIIEAKTSLTITYRDFSSLDPPQMTEALRELSLELFETPFDLGCAAPLRVAVADTATGGSLIVVVIHHIIADYGSLITLYREIKQAYTAISAGRQPTFASTPTSYGDFCQWQRNGQRSRKYLEQLAYWKKHLAGLDPLVLALDFPRANDRANRAERVMRVLSQSLSERLRLRLRTENVTAFMLTLAAFKIVLARYTGETDIAVATPITGRNSEDLADAVGPYVNDLVLRTNLSGDPTLHEVIQRLRETAIAAFANQDVPFEQIVEELRLPRSAGRHPLCNISFRFLHDLSTDFPEVVAINVGQATAKLDLSHLVIEEELGYRLFFEYNTALFERQSIEQIASLMHWVLEQIAEDPTVRLSQLRLSTGSSIDTVSSHQPVTDGLRPNWKRVSGNEVRGRLDDSP